MNDPRIMAVDWSGALRGAERRIWVAEARAGELVALTGGLSREAAMAHVIGAGEVVAGFDFAFFSRAGSSARSGAGPRRSCGGASSATGEAWLAACEPPFWGRPGRRRPERGPDEPELRRTEMRAGGGDAAETPVARGRPKSGFQVGGAGSVGTGSLRGMPFLPVLRRAGFALWPWDDARVPMAFEIYPRTLTGPVVKSSAEAREAHLAGDPRIPPGLLPTAVGSEDAFDAAVSALEIAARLPDLPALRAAGDPEVRLEGAIWPPPSGRST